MPNQPTKQKLISYLQNIRVLRSKAIISAFTEVDRQDFLRAGEAAEAYEDTALPIGHGQTISQPQVVAIMLELLSPRAGEKILDVGSGSGWTTALLANIVGEKGEVRGAEIIPELVFFGQENIKKYNFKNAFIEKAGRELGLPQYAPYDKILVSAATDGIPEKLLSQLKDGGVMVIPIGHSIQKITKLANKKYKTETLHGFAFVPLIKT